MVKRLTELEYKEKIKNLYNDEYELIGEFKTTQDKIIIHHKTCGNKFHVVANEFTRTRVQKRFKEKGCPGCLERIRPLESVLEELEILTDGKLILIGDYKGTHSKVLLHCNICDFEWDKTDFHTLFGNLKTNLTNTHGCPKCSNKYKKNTEDFKKEVRELIGDEYTVIGEYIDTNTLIKINHSRCNNSHSVRPVDFLHKENRCPICAAEQKESRKIKYIRELLDVNNINYSLEQKFEDLFNYSKTILDRKYYLPFDLFLEKYNVIIEYDGEQHFKPTFSKKSFKLTYKNDNKKNQWMKEIGNDYIFIRLHYKLKYDDIYKIINELLETNTLSEETIQGYGLLFKPRNSNIIINEEKYYTQINKSYLYTGSLIKTS